MTKQELLSTYTAEQLAKMVEEMQNVSEEKITKCEIPEDGKMLKGRCNKCGEEFIVFLENRYLLCTKAKFFGIQDANKQLNKDVDRLQSEVVKYRKAFENAKKERDRQVCEYQKKIDELERKSDIFFPEEPLKVADLIINGWKSSWDYKSFGVSEIRQIAEHLLVYCNHHGEAEE